MGGWSKEREISLISGNAVYESLLRSNMFYAEPNTLREP